MLTHSMVIAYLGIAALLNPVSQLQPVGQAQLSYLFWNVYDSTLYTANGAYQPEVYPQALSITYLLDIKKTALIDSTREQWQKIGIYNATRQEPWLQKLATIWPTQVRENDNLTLMVDAQQRSYFYLNGQKIGLIEDTGFGQQFLAIWLSPNTEYPELRQQLLGQAETYAFDEDEYN